MSATDRPRTAGIDKSSPLPYYEQLRQLLLRQIAEDGLEPGALLPSEAELCERYDVSRTVVRQAVGELVNEGRLRRHRGKGTFVAGPKLNEQFMQSTVGFFEDLTSRGHDVRSQVLSCDPVDPPDQAREALELTVGERCIELIRLRSVNGEVLTYTRSYLPVDLAPNLPSRLRAGDLEHQSLYRMLEDAGITIASGHRSLEAIAANERLAGLLDVDPGSPVLYIESLARDGRGTPVEFFRAWHRGDRTRLEVDVVDRA